MPQVGTPRSVLQESVHAALSGLNPALADMYEGARLILAEDQPLPGWPRFVPHAIREVVRSLPETLEIATEQRIEYQSRLDTIARLWEREGLPLEGIGLAGPDQTVATPSIELLDEIASLVQENHQRPTQRVRLQRLADHQAPDADSDTANRWAGQLLFVYQWAQRRAHQPARRSRAPSLDEYRAELGKFETALAGLLAEYGPNKGIIDDILAETNRRADQRG